MAEAMGSAEQAAVPDATVLDGAPDEEAEKPALLPFSPGRCVWNSAVAADPKKCEPFAKLAIRVNRAVRLIAADLTGKSDPYVTMGLNGDTGFCRTEHKMQTLAPTWDEEFELPIHHPRDVLSLKVYDYDMITVHRLGGGDDLIGWLNIHLELLPFNEWIAGAFKIEHPKDLECILQGSSRSDPPKEAGKLFLEMCLQANPDDELWAMCLPEPKNPFVGSRKSLTEFDLGVFMEGLVNLARRSQVFFRAGQLIAVQLSNYVTPLTVWFIAGIIIWLPNLLLPVIVLMLGAAVYWSDIYLNTALKEVKEKQQVVHRPSKVEVTNNFLTEGSMATTLQWAQGLAKKAQSVSQKAVKSVKFSRTEVMQVQYGEPLLDGDGNRETEQSEIQQTSAVAQLVPVPEQTDISDDEDLPQRQMSGIAKRLQKLQYLIPKTLQRELEDVEEVIELLVGLLEQVENLIMNRWTRSLIKASFLIVTIILIWFRDWQVLLIQVGLSGWLTFLCFESSSLGVFVAGYSRYRNRKPRALNSSTRTDHHENDSDATDAHNHKSLQISTSAVTALTMEPATASNVGSPVTGPRSSRDLLNHEFEDVTFKSPIWCSECGNFLWGLDKQGKMCWACKRVVCKACVRCAVPDCQPINDDSTSEDVVRLASRSRLSCCSEVYVTRSEFRRGLRRSNSHVIDHLDEETEPAL